MNEISYNNLDYNAYIFSEDLFSFNENIRYATAEFNKLHVRKIRLPDGKNNIIYMLSDTFDNAIQMIARNNFIIPTTYRRLYYPFISIGQFMDRKYRINVRKLQKERSDIILQKTKLRPYNATNLQPGNDNIFFVTSDIYASVKPIMEKFSLKRNYESFFPEFIRILNNHTPDAKNKDNNPSSNNKILIIDADMFAFKSGSPIKENKTNPLFLIYLKFLKTRDLSKWNVDMDMLICSKNMFLKFNPSKLNTKTWVNFRNALFRILNTNLDDYTAKLKDEEKDEIEMSSKDKLLTNIIDDVTTPYTNMISPSVKATLIDSIEKNFKKKAREIAEFDKAIKNDQKEISKSLGVSVNNSDKLYKQQPSSIIHTDPVVNPLSKDREKLFKSIIGYEPLGVSTGEILDDEEDYEDYDKPEDDYDEYEDDIKDDVTEIMNTDEEVISDVLDEIQNKTVPLNNIKTAPINSARDKKLREEQKKIVVRNSTIEEILKRDKSSVPIETTDVSSVMHTTNKNMHNIKFANFDKTYIEELYTSDILAMFDSLKDKSSPFYITGIDIEDTSTAMDLKETWTVHLTDENKKRHTIKVDIPKFQNDRFMLINGTRWIILKQNFYNPLVKDTPDTVILTTNYHKITIRRKATKSIGTVERIFSLIKKTGDVNTFITGDSTTGNLKYISSLEYDELARRLFKFTSNGCEICFSRDYIKDNMEDKIPSDIKGNEFYIGNEGEIPILINEDTGLDRAGRTIADIIESNLSDEYKALFSSIKPPSQLMYAEAKMAGEWIPIVVAFLIWVGLSKTLDKMQIEWKFNEGSKRIPQQDPNKKYIKFSDGILEYEAKTFAELILNGINKLHPEELQFSDFDTEAAYDEFIYTQWGNYNGITELTNFYEFLIDPITKSVCEDLMLPTEPDELCIFAVKLLCDNSFVSKASDKSYRTRSIEMIPAILYSCIASQYKAYVKSGRRLPMTLNQKCVINKLIAEKTVEAYSTLNPVIEVNRTHTISTKGYKGSNSEHSYDEEKRSYDPSSVGKLAISTSPDANVGITKQLVIEPTISNARGYRDQVDDIETLRDINIFSPVEMLTPGTARNEDPIRTAIAGKQSQHVVPVADASPSLVSNGFDEAVQFHLSDDFVINADEDGEVIDVNEEIGFVIVKYKSGKTRAIYTKPEIVKNSGGGFYVSNILTPVYTKVGQKFRKHEPLAYHPNYFQYSKLNGLRYKIGPLVKMALMSSYNTYEDAGICTESMAERMKTNIVFPEIGRFKKNNNIIYMAKIGDKVNIGDVLIKFDMSVEDNELAKYLSKLSDDNANILEEESKNDIKATHAGVIKDIQVYTLLDPSNLSPSLGKIVQDYFNKGKVKKEYLEQYDQTNGTIKAGYLLKDNTEPIKNRYNSIKGDKGVDVRIEIYIEHSDVMGVGDKIALYSANKQIVSEVIPKGFEPYSEFRPDEEISVMTSPGTIARRMTPAVIQVGAAIKCLIELKRKIKDEIRYK